MAVITIPIHESVLARIDADPTILERLMRALADILTGTSVTITEATRA